MIRETIVVHRSPRSRMSGDDLEDLSPCGMAVAVVTHAYLIGESKDDEMDDDEQHELVVIGIHNTIKDIQRTLCITIEIDGSLWRHSR